MRRLLRMLPLAAMVLVGCGDDEPRATKPEGLTDSEWGERLYRELGCVSCHATDGRRGAGPPLDGIYGQEVELTSGDRVTVDEDYLRESIREPQVKVVLGYVPNMPSYEEAVSDEQLDALTTWIRSLR